MRYYIDTEYAWTPSEGQIVPISIGVVAEDGREFYAVTTAFAPRACSQFVQDVVLPVLWEGVSHSDQTDMGTIASDLRQFIVGKNIEFWGDYADFDYVVLSMLMGEFDQWPDSWPMFINDAQQAPGMDIPESLVPHNALADARAIRDGYDNFWGF